MTIVRYGWLAIVLGMLIPLHVQAQMPNLNPFKSMGPMSSGSGSDWYPGKYVKSGWDSMSNSVSSATKSASNWSVLPKPTQPTFTPQQPSTMGKMWNSTKDAMHSTYDFCNPWYSRPKYPGPFSPTGNTDYLNNRPPLKKATTNEEPPWWYPWPADAPEEKPRTVQEWMKLKRPGFGN